jgi:hypothetical protein
MNIFMVGISAQLGDSHLGNLGCPAWPLTCDFQRYIKSAPAISIASATLMKFEDDFIKSDSSPFVSGESTW